MIESWKELFENSALLRSVILYAHLGGIVIGGGSAIATDRLTLLAPANDPHQLRIVSGIHRLVVISIVFIALSGLLMLAADLDTFLVSKVFWTKMFFVVMLLINGLRLLRAEHAARDGAPVGWARLRSASIASLILWLVIAFLGSVLPNV
jgi:hypothetical protein